MFVASKDMVVTSKKVKEFADILYFYSELRLEEGPQEFEAVIDERFGNVRIFNIGFRLSAVFDKVETIEEGLYYRIEGHIVSCQRVKECRHIIGALSQARYLTGKKFLINYRVGFQNKLGIYSDERNLHLDKIRRIQIHDPIAYDRKTGIHFLKDKISTKLVYEGYELCEKHYVDFSFECEYRAIVDFSSFANRVKKNKFLREEVIAEGRILYCVGEVRDNVEGDNSISMENLPESPSKDRLFVCSEWFRWKKFAIVYEGCEFFIKFM